MRALVSVSMALILVSAPAFANEMPEAPKDKRICKVTEEGRTGTHLGGRSKVCRKASEWKELEDNTERSLREIDDRRAPDSFGASPAAGPTPNPLPPPRN